VTSVAFDRAAGYYDRTRAISAAAEAELVGLLAGEIAGRPAVEIGVGTGRIGWPLRRAGVDLIGLDLSRPMLERLVANGGGDRFPIVEGDCTRLPFAPGSFGAVVASHVFHLVSDWRGAVAEARRVLRPGGVLLVSRGGWQGLKHDVATHFTDETGIDKPPVVGLDAPTDLGLPRRALPVVVDRQRVSLDELIGTLEQGQLAWMWDLDPDLLAEAGARTRVWAHETYGSLEEAREQVSEVAWHAYDF
jgi:SAM-dependent methyltransferase